jgi:hypothetical protein
MDGMRFDRWTKTLTGGVRSRREALRLALGSGIAAAAFGRAPGAAFACRRNRKRCARNQANGNCCSGTCKRGKCRPTPGAKGCTVEMGGCRTFNECPRNPDGTCTLLDNGKPFCVEFSRCEACASHDDCPVFEGIRGKCATSECPDACSHTVGRICVYGQDPFPT